MWKNRADDTPLRTIKTVLYTLGKLKKHEVSKPDPDLISPHNTNTLTNRQVMYEINENHQLGEILLIEHSCPFYTEVSTLGLSTRQMFSNAEDEGFLCLRIEGFVWIVLSVWRGRERLSCDPVFVHRRF